MRNFIALLLLGYFSSGTAQASELPLGAYLQGLLNYARQQNPEFTAMRYEADAAHQRVQAAAALPDPILRTELMDVTNRGTNNDFSVVPSQVGSTRYTLMQSVPWFGRRGLQRGVAESQLLQSEGQVAAGWAELSNKIKFLYAQRYYLTGSEQLIQETLDLVGGLENLVRTRYANGLDEQQSVLSLQIEQTDLQTELLKLQTEQHHVRGRLNSVLSRPAMAELAQPAQLRALPVAAQFDYPLLAEKLRVNNPQLTMAAARKDEADKSRDLVFNNRYPDFILGLAPTQTGSRINEWGLMIEMNIPLQQDARRSRERAAEAMLAAFTARKEALLNQLLSDLSEAVASLETARRNESLIALQLLPQAELTYQSALAGYESGKIDLPTLLNAQRQILKSRQQHLQVQFEAQVLLAEIEKLLGEEL